jgi:hypothetical protein
VSNEAAVEKVKEYLAKKWNTWVWESLVDDVAEILQLKMDGFRELASDASVRALRLQVPTSVEKQLTVTPSHEAAHLVARLIQSTFDDAANGRLSTPAFRKSPLLWQFVPKEICDEVDGLLGQQLVAIDEMNRFRSPGVYALWRYPSLTCPAYVGKAKDIGSRVKAHTKRYRRTFVKFLSGPRFDAKYLNTAERILIHVLNPSENAC